MTRRTAGSSVIERKVTAHPVYSARTRHVAEVATLLVMLSWGANVVAVKAVIADVPPILFSFARFGSAFLVLLAILRWREGSVCLPRRDIVPMLLLGLAGFGLYQDLWATALGRTTASNSALITAATPVSTILIAAAVGSDTISRPKVVGAVIALAGTVAVVLAHARHRVHWCLGRRPDDLRGHRLLGVLRGLWGAGPAPPLAASDGCLGDRARLPRNAPVGALASHDVRSLRIHAGTIVLYPFCALVTAAAANVVMFEAVKVLGPARTTLFQFLVPAFAVMLAAVLLGESIVLRSSAAW